MLFWKKTPPTQTADKAISHEVDFEARITELQELSNSAQATFLYKYIQMMDDRMCKTVLRYAKSRLTRLLNSDNNDTTDRILAERDGQPRSGARLHFTSNSRQYPLTPKDAYPADGEDSGGSRKDNW